MDSFSQTIVDNNELEATTALNSLLSTIQHITGIPMADRDTIYYRTPTTEYYYDYC